MPEPIEAINCATIIQLIKRRHGLDMHYREVYKRMTRRATHVPPVEPIAGGYRSNGVSWPLDKYVLIESYLLKREPYTLPPLSSADISFLRTAGRIVHSGSRETKKPVPVGTMFYLHRPPAYPN